MNLDLTQVTTYLTERLGEPVRVLGLQPLGGDLSQQAGDQHQHTLKAFGYGQPILVSYQVGGEQCQAVLRTMAANPFGHERRADRALGMLLNYDSFNDLPRHVRALDVGAITADGRLQSVGDGAEFFLLTEYAPGVPYAVDLLILRDGGECMLRDERRAQLLAEYLAAIHQAPHNDPTLYRRHIRDVFGSGEGIVGLIDSYPSDDEIATPAWLEEVERQCVAWRWRLVAHPERLRQIHGDFHPYNVLFTADDSFTLLDRSRGPWGEPADDVGCMAINYLFFSLQRNGKLALPFEQLWHTFWTTYLTITEDHQLLRLVQPFFAWRALVLASPHWYRVPTTVRRKLCAFAENVLHERVFDPARVNTYLQG